MVQIKDEPPEGTEEVEINGVILKTRCDYMVFLKDQLENHLPKHERQIDVYMANLQRLLSVPGYADEGADQVSVELRQKRDELLELLKERKEITTWLWKYFKMKRRPFAPLRECREQAEKLFDGKKRFYDTCKEVDELLRKFHGTTSYVVIMR